MSREVEKTQTAIERLKTFHAMVGGIVRCEWSVYRAEMSKLLQIDEAVIDALRVSGFYLHTDKGLMYSA